MCKYLITDISDSVLGIFALSKIIYPMYYEVLKLNNLSIINKI